MIREYVIKMSKTNDFVIISLDMITNLVEMIKVSESKRIEVEMDGIISSNYSEYMLRVLNTNRKKKPFRFKHILSENLMIDDFYQITVDQFQYLILEGEKCFKSCELGNHNNHLNIQLDIQMSFYNVCKDSNSSIDFIHLNR